MIPPRSVVVLSTLPVISMHTVVRSSITQQSTVVQPMFLISLYTADGALVQGNSAQFSLVMVLLSIAAVMPEYPGKPIRFIDNRASVGGRGGALFWTLGDVNPLYLYFDGIAYSNNLALRCMVHV